LKVWILTEKYSGNFCGVFSTQRRAKNKAHKDGAEGYDITQVYVDIQDEHGYVKEVEK